MVYSIHTYKQYCIPLKVLSWRDCPTSSPSPAWWGGRCGSRTWSRSRRTRGSWGWGAPHTLHTHHTPNYKAYYNRAGDGGHHTPSTPTTHPAENHVQYTSAGDGGHYTPSTPTTHPTENHMQYTQPYLCAVSSIFSVEFGQSVKNIV